MNAYLKKHLKQLIGGKIEALVEDPDDDEYLGLAVRMPTGKLKIVWPLRDPEGNGPGHLDIQDNEVTR